MHDAHEAIISDIPYPVKSLKIFRPALSVIENAFDRYIYDCLELDYDVLMDEDNKSLVKKLDWEMFEMELYQNRPDLHKTHKYHGHKHTKEFGELKSYTSSSAKKQYLRLLDSLLSEVTI